MVTINTVYLVTGPDEIHPDTPFQEAFAVYRDALLMALYWAGDDPDQDYDAPDDDLRERLAMVLNTTGEPISVRAISLVGDLVGEVA